MATRILTAILLLALAAPTLRADTQAHDNAKARLASARQTYDGMLKRWALDPAAPVDCDKISQWSRRWMEAERELAAAKEAKAAAIKSHLERMTTFESRIKELRQQGFAAAHEASAAEYFRLEAEQWLRQAQ